MNINNQIGPEKPVGRDQAVPSRKTGKTESSGRTRNTPEQSREIQDTERSVTDTVKFSRDVEKLTQTVEKMEDTPRQDVIDRVATRIKNGEYNKPEFMEALAVKLVDTNTVNE